MTVFDRYADHYDQTRRQLIPCFDAFYRTAVDLLPFAPTKHLDVLDLGAGTGLLAGMIMQRYPNARMVLLDASEKMLRRARARLKDAKNQPECRLGNFASAPLGGRYDAIVSALAIHHLDADGKRRLFSEAHRCLKPQGVFVNADQVLGSSDTIERQYRDNWHARVLAAGITEKALAEALERMAEDQMSTLSDQLAWLKQAGFKHVNCWFKDYSFVVYAGTSTPSR